MTNVLVTTPTVSISSLFDRVEALFKQAEIALTKEQFDLAHHFFQAAHSKDPENLQLAFQEAQIWHRYAKILSHTAPFQKGYRCYKECFNEPTLKDQAHRFALELKLDEFETLDNINAIQDAIKLIRRIESKADISMGPEFALQKARVLHQSAKYYQDPQQLTQALDQFKTLYEGLADAETAFIIAEILSDLHYLTQDPNLLLQSMEWRKQALEHNSSHLRYYEALAQDYQKFYTLTLDENQIQNFHEMCELAAFVQSDSIGLYLIWAEGLITMGISAQKSDWVKLGMEKCHEALTRSSCPLMTDLLVARGLCYLGTDLDRLSHLHEAMEKIKHYDEDPTHGRLVVTYYEILMGLGRYFQDVDYFYQAIEKLQESLSINKSTRLYWELIAKTYLEINKLDHNPLTIEMASRFADKTLAFYRCPESLLLKATILSRLGELKQNGDILEEALGYFEVALDFHKIMFQPKLSHLFDYARTLDLIGNFHEEESYYIKALEQLTQIVLCNPQYPELHHQIALTQFHLGELTLSVELVKKSLQHFKLAAMGDNDAIYVDWAIACLSLSEMVDTSYETIFLQQEAASKLKKALKQGHTQAYYFMACLCSVCGEYDKAIEFLKIAERHESLPNHEDIGHDEWLNPLKDNPEFQRLLERQEMRRH